jgi:hypothetical protein
MAYVFATPNVGMPPIGSALASSAVAGRSTPWKIGDIERAVDPTYGGAEVIYLQGCVGTAAGLGVTYNAQTGATTLLSTSGTTERGAPVAFATGATNLTTLYGWYVIDGAAVILKTAVKVDPASTLNVHISATAGRIMQTSVAGRQIVGARFATAVTVTSTTSTAVVTLNRPHVQSKIT